MNVQGQGAYRSTDACARCGRGIDTRSAAYAAEGMVCRGCEAQESLGQAQAASIGSQAGLGAIGWGILSLFCNVLFIPSILAITAGVKDLRALKDPAIRQSLGPRCDSVQAKAIVGIVLASLHPLAMVGLVCLVIMGGIVGALSGSSYESPLYEDSYYDSYDPYGAYDPYDPYGGNTYGGNTYDDVYGGGAPPPADPAAFDDVYAPPAAPAHDPGYTGATR